MIYNTLVYSLIFFNNHLHLFFKYIININTQILKFLKKLLQFINLKKQNFI